MSTFAGNEKWRSHPRLRFSLRYVFPGFTWALAALTVVTVAEYFLPASSGHDAAHAMHAGQAGPQTAAAKKTGEGSHGVH